jgi:DNA-binding CsgD family transcriptional regulator
MQEPERQVSLAQEHDIDLRQNEVAMSHLERALLVADLGQRAIDLISPSQRYVPKGFDELSPTEIEILDLLCEGLGNNEIARRRYNAEQTIKFHLSNTYRKLGVRNRTEAAKLRLAMLGNQAAIDPDKLKEAAGMLIKGAIVLASIPETIVLSEEASPQPVAQLIVLPSSDNEPESGAETLDPPERLKPKAKKPTRTQRIVDTLIDNAGRPITYAELSRYVYDDEEASMAEKAKRSRMLFNMQAARINQMLDVEGYRLLKRKAKTETGNVKVVLICVRQDSEKVVSIEVDGEEA